VTGDPFRCAADDIDNARCQAVLRGDIDTAKRLQILCDRVLVEAEYAENFRHGMPMVRRRVLPQGATVGWLLRHCAATREARRALGVSVPHLGVSDIAEARGLAA